jgi:dienelactone hydrolase
VLAGGVSAAVLATTGTARPPAAHSDTPSAAVTRTPAPRAPAPRPRPTERLPVGIIGRYAIARHAVTIVDRTRPRLGTRVLPTVVLSPVIPAAAASDRLARGLFPLVVFAPGYRQCDRSYSYLLHQWASAGYVVAAVEFPRTNCHVAEPDEYDLANQPADMAYVIDRLVATSGRPHGALAGLVDPAEIAVAGHSDGGDTVAALAANTCCLDHKVDAAIVLSGAEWPPLPGRYFAAAAPPMLFIQGTADSWNPPPASMQLYQADTTGRRYYLELFGANHFTPYEGSGPPEPVVARVTVDFLDRFLAGQRGASAAMRRAGDVTGTAALASGGHAP